MFIKCNYDSDDCFANLHGECKILREHIAYRIKCPFYKSKEKHIEDVRRCAEHNRKIGKI